MKSLHGVRWSPFFLTLALGGLLWAGFGQSSWVYEQAAGTEPTAWLHAFVHFEAAHLGLNLLGLVAVLALFPALMRQGFFPLGVVALFLVYSALVVQLIPGPVWGLSGPLHGLFVWAVLSVGLGGGVQSSARQALFKAALLGGLTAKLLAEAYLDASAPGVAWGLHFLGALAGFLVWSLELLVRGIWESCRQAVLGDFYQ